jgi:hypothetical protein
MNGAYYEETVGQRSGCVLRTARQEKDRKDVLQLLGWLLLLGCTSYVLPAPRVVSAGLDEGWKAFLSFAFLARKHFGTEVVFTYGPWGFLLYPRDFPGIFPWAAFGRFILLFGCAGALAALGVCWIQRPPLRFLWASAILLIAQPTYLLMPLLFLMLWFEPAPKTIWQRIPLHVVAFAVGLAANTKFTSLLILFFLLPVLFLRSESRWLILTTTGSFLFFWLLAGQPPANLPAFIVHSATLASDYGTAMVFGEFTWQDWTIALALCGIPVAVVAAAALQQHRLRSLVHLAWFSLFEFILFRQATVRLDIHQLVMGFVTGAFPVALTLIPPPHLWKFAGRYSVILRRSFAAGILVSGTWACLYTMGPLQRRVAAGAPSFSLDMQGRAGRSKRTELPAAGPGEAVGIFPWDLSSVLQNGIPLSNLPVIQSYAAYSPRLSALNSRFLRGEAAPSRIYFEVGPIDNRYPTLEDALSWRSLVTHYQPVGLQNGFLVLHRSVRPRHFTLQPILCRDLKPDEAIAIPSDVYPVIWAEIHAKRTLWGRFLNASFRAPKLVLNIETSTGEHRFSFLSEVADAGFFLSPWVDDTLAMKDLYTPSSRPSSAKRVKRISLSGQAFADGRFSSKIVVNLLAFSTRDGEAEGSADDEIAVHDARLK